MDSNQEWQRNTILENNFTYDAPKEGSLPSMKRWGEGQRTGLSHHKPDPNCPGAIGGYDSVWTTAMIFRGQSTPLPGMQWDLRELTI